MTDFKEKLSKEGYNVSQTIIYNGNVYTEHGKIEQGYIHICDGKIKKVGQGDFVQQLDVNERQHVEMIDAKGHHILPGFIDIHIHGGYGEDAMDASFKGLQHLSQSLLSEGTTSFLATTMTQSTDNITKALSNIANYSQQQSTDDCAEIIGIHLEGPFISEHKVGAQHPQFVQRPSSEKIRNLQQTANGLIKIITFAPEVEGALDTLNDLKDEFIFSIGHTIATFDQTNEAVTNGAKHITHLYNAASPFLHREPGVFGAAWLSEQLNTELIVDGVHAHPAAVNIAYRLKGNKHFYLITDAMRAKGMPDGDYDLGGQNVIVKDNEARLADGTLAGSILTMNQGLHNLLNYTEAHLEELWRVTSLNQAIALNIDDSKGSIKENKDADLVIVNDQIDVITTIKNGKKHNYKPY